MSLFPASLTTPWAATLIGLLVNILLSGGKIFIGLLCRSQVLLADGLHSCSDLISDFAILLGLRISQKPADHNHPYGHRRFQALAATCVGLMLLLAAGWIAWQAIIHLRHPGDIRNPLMPFLVALLSVPVKELLYRLTVAAGKRAKDISLIANAWHHRSDAFTSLAAAAGLGGVVFGGEKWAILDPLTALILASFIGVMALRIGWESIAELVDHAPCENIRRAIAEVVAQTPGVKDFHALRTRRIGGRVAMDVHVLVDPQLTVVEGHGIASDVKQRIFACDCDVIEVIVHIEPHAS